MGASVSRLGCCFVPKSQQDAVTALFSDPLDEGLGHSFVYVRPVVDSLGCTLDTDELSQEFEAAVNSFQEQQQQQQQHENPTTTTTMTTTTSLAAATMPISSTTNGPTAPGPGPASKSIAETSFKSISGASVSANTATPRCIVYHEQFNSLANVPVDRAAAFESTSSFSALPLQPIPRGISFSGPMSGPLASGAGGERGFLSGPLERNSSAPLERGFLSGPIERGFMSGPMERGYNSGPFEQFERTNFSGPLSGSGPAYWRRRSKYLARMVRTVGKPMKKALSKTVSNLTRTTRRSLVAPMKSFSTREMRSTGSTDARRDLRSFLNSPQSTGYSSSDVDGLENHNLHWAQGKAGEDRVHVVLSEEHGWLFVGIYDGFSGPDATDFLMSNLYPAIYKELKGLLWDHKKAFQLPPRWRSSSKKEGAVQHATDKVADEPSDEQSIRGLSQAKVSDLGAEIRRWDSQNGSVAGVDVRALDGSNRLENVDKIEEEARSDGNVLEEATAAALQVNGHADLTGAAVKQVNGRPKTLLTARFRRRRRGGNQQRKVFQYRCEWEQERLEAEKLREEQRQRLQGRRPVNHAAVLKALSRALQNTEESYMEMIEDMVEDNPELALMGSCVLVMLMKDEDVYIMNVGDSRAVLAQHRKAVMMESLRPSSRQKQGSDEREKLGTAQELERIVEETPMDLAAFEAHNSSLERSAPPSVSLTLGALQLSLDHTTQVMEEVLRLTAEHPDDAETILNGRVKGKLAVTRAFGAGFLKQPKWNDALLEVFRIRYIGTAPYVTCSPSLRHYKLGPQDQFMVLSSDGLYQYMSNDEVVSHVEWFMDKYPDGDPAQFLIEEVLFRAARKAGMEFHDLLDIPQGDRRKYHDDLSVMVISLEGRIWRSSS